MKLASGRAAVRAVRDPIDDERTHAADALPAIAVERDRILACPTNEGTPRRTLLLSHSLADRCYDVAGGDGYRALDLALKYHADELTPA